MVQDGRALTRDHVIWAYRLLLDRDPENPAQFLAQIAAFGYRAHHLEHGSIGAAIDRAPEETLVSAVFVPVP